MSGLLAGIYIRMQYLYCCLPLVEERQDNNPLYSQSLQRKDAIP
ncbi:MAG: hypothetical protein ACETWK_02470 [Candidatus Aminicenantaceae bacterium]